MGAGVKRLALMLPLLLCLSACKPDRHGPPPIPNGFTVQQEKTLPDMDSCRAMMEDHMKGGGVAVKARDALVMREILNTGFVVYQQCDTRHGNIHYTMARSDTALKPSKPPLFAPQKEEAAPAAP